MAYSLKIDGQTLHFKTSGQVFYPTNTSELLIMGSHKGIEKPGRMLELGCGIGVIGITLARLGLVRGPVFASDLSAAAVEIAEQNARDHGCEIVVRRGSMFEPWQGEKFDYIVDDVPGITEEVASLSRWFPQSVPCNSGKDGADLITQVIQEAPQHLEPQGRFIFPVLSLSNTERITQAARESFRDVKRLIRRMWSLPEELKLHMDFLRQLQADRKIFLEQKFGMVLWYTDVYIANN